MRYHLGDTKVFCVLFQLRQTLRIGQIVVNGTNTIMLQTQVTRSHNYTVLHSATAL